MSAVSVKLLFHEDTSVVARRLTLPPVAPFSNLRELCNDHLKSPRVYITYVDCDSDAVLVESEAELTESVRCGMKSENAVRLHVAATLAASSHGASRWERRHAAAAAASSFSSAVRPPLEIPTPASTVAARRPELCMSREALAGTAVPPPVPPGPWFGHHHHYGRWLGSGGDRRWGAPPLPNYPPPPPASVVGMLGQHQVVAELPADVLERVDSVAASVLANPAFATDVVAAVRAYTALRAAGGEAVNVNGARQQAHFALHRAGMALLTSGDAAAARPLLEAAAGMAPRYPPARYNVGCVRALCGDKPGALEALREAVALGWHKARHMEEDPDLVSLRGDAEFAAIAASIRAARPRFGPPFRHHWGVGVTVGGSSAPPPPPPPADAPAAAAAPSTPTCPPAEPPVATEVAPPAAASDDVVVVETADCEPSAAPAASLPPAAPAAPAATPVAAPAPALCVSRRAVAAGQLAAMGFADAAAVDTALAACRDNVEEAVAILLARS